MLCDAPKRRQMLRPVEKRIPLGFHNLFSLSVPYLNYHLLRCTSSDRLAIATLGLRGPLESLSLPKARPLPWRTPGFRKVFTPLDSYIRGA